MDDLESVGPGPSKTPKKRKGDLQSEGKKSAGVVKTRGEQADARVSGSKRVLQDSPTRVEVPAKRLRVGGKSTGKRVVSTDINLGEYTFDEDSVINPELVPRVVGKVGASAMVREDCADRTVGLRLLHSWGEGEDL